MKKFLLLLVACVSISIGVQAKDVIGVTLSHDTVILNVGSSVTLTAAIDPSDAGNKSVVWKTENSAIALLDTTSTINNLECIVVGFSEGETKVSVRSLDGGNETDTCVIKVVKPVTSLALSENTMSIIIGRDSVLIAEITPSDATDKSIEWVSSDSSIVNIESTDENRNDVTCKIIALKPGTAHIEARIGSITASCEVTVDTVPTESFTLDHDSIELIVGFEAAIIAQIRPLDGTYKYVSWKSDDILGDIVTITSSGRDTICRIKATGIGEAKIIAEDYGGRTDTCVVTVRGIPLEGMSLSSDSIELNLNADTVLMAVVFPHYATNDSIEWISSDSTIVDIISPVLMMNDTICYIKALRSGQAEIIAKTFDGGFLDTCVITVVIPVDSVVLDSELITTLDLKTDSVGTLTARIYPDSATNKSLEWINLGDSLVRIDSIIGDTVFHFTVLRTGVDTIYAVTPCGIKSRFSFIHIPFREVDSVRISQEETVTIVDDTIRLSINESFELFTTVYPSNATNDTVNLISDNPEVVSIDSISGSVFITALKEGRAIIYALSEDTIGNQRDSCIVEVRFMPISGMSLNKDTIRIYEQSIGTVIAELLPADATNDSIVWSTNDISVIQIEASTGSNPTCTFKGLRSDTAYIYAETKEGGYKDTCVVIVKKQVVFLEADTVSASVDGIIELSLLMPNDAGILFGSFTLQLPDGFGLAVNDEGTGFKTMLADEFNETLALSIVRENDSTYIFNINPIAMNTNSMLRSGTLKKLMDIAYTIYDDALDGSADIYEAVVKDLTISFSDGTNIKEDQADVEIKSYKDPTGNDIIGGSETSYAYIVDGSLYVNSDKAETVYVYSLSGKLLYMKQKSEGPAVFNIDTQEKILIVKGSSGWVNKVANR